MPQPLTLEQPDTWHAAEAAEERAWLDQWARAERTPEAPWARPDHNPMADLTAHLSALTLAAGRP